MKRPNGRAESNWVFVSRFLARAHQADRVVVNGINPDDFIFSETKDDYFLFMAAMNRAMDKGLDLALALSRSEGFRLVVAGTGLNYETIIMLQTPRGGGRRIRRRCTRREKAELLECSRSVVSFRLNEDAPDSS
jgi:hypothetical protein